MPVLSRNRLLMAPLDLLDRLISLPFGGSGKLPPNHLRIRVGAGNRILFNQVQHRLVPVNFWLGVFASGLVRLDSRILDLGCGCGRYAATLRDFAWAGKKFTGRYTGIDIDREMIEWCRANFPADHFTFKLTDVPSAVYNPGGSGVEVPAFDVADASQDFVFALSLLTHLLAEELQRYLEETWRVLAPGSPMHMTVFAWITWRAGAAAAGPFGTATARLILKIRGTRRRRWRTRRRSWSRRARGRASPRLICATPAARACCGRAKGAGENG